MEMSYDVYVYGEVREILPSAGHKVKWGNVVIASLSSRLGTGWRWVV